MATCWSLLCKYGNFKPFYPHDVAIPGAKILLNFLDYLYFCHILLDAYNCIFWHLFPFWHIFASLPYFSISICHFHWYLFPIIFSFSHIFPTFPTFFSHILSSFSIFTIGPPHKRFCLL